MRYLCPYSRLGPRRRFAVTLASKASQVFFHSAASSEGSCDCTGDSTPMEALQAATLVPAKAMGIEKETGTIEPGKRADLVILGADPLENISNIRRTDKVVQGGVIYDCAALWRSVGFQP